jgi:thiamine biosynthesis lipoprotein
LNKSSFSISRRNWLIQASSWIGAAGIGAVTGCSSEPFAHFEAIAFSAPAQLAIWGLQDATRAKLAKKIWKKLNDMDEEVLQAHLTPEVDFQMRGAALDEAASILQGRELDGALLSIGEHVLALGERGYRPWHVGVPNPINLKPLLSFDLFADERLITLGQYAAYRQKEGDQIVSKNIESEVGDCASCSVILRGSGGARLAKIATELYASSKADWPVVMKREGLDTVLWVSKEGGFEATKNFASRTIMVDSHDSLTII